MQVLVVGSSVIDLFLDIDADHVEIKDKKASFNLGDKVPSQIKKSAIGGNGANVSVGFSRLEIPTTFYTYLGNDFFSREIQEGLSREGIALDIEQHDETNSPLHIILDFPQDRVILSNYSKNQHGFSPKEKVFDYIFLTSIPEDWEDAYRKILEFSKSNNIPIAFSPGTRQIEEKNALIEQTLASSKIYFSNKDEAIKIVNSQSSIINPKQLLLAVKQLGPEIVSITDGAGGAYAIDGSNNCYFIKPAPSQRYEKTGAGDAYAAAFFAAILNEHDVPTAMSWGTLSSGGVMQKIGAQTGLLTRKQLDEQIKTNNNLKAEKI